MKKLEEFTINPEDVWIILLDGHPIQGYGQAGFATRRSASSSFNYRIGYRYKDYGFNSPGDMRKALEEQGRLVITRV